MLYSRIFQLFLSFSGAADNGELDGFVNCAMHQVRQELKPDADVHAPALDYYAAALANLLYRKTLAAQGAVMPTYAGMSTSRRLHSEPAENARQLMLSYRGLCAPLLQDHAFLFHTMKAGESHD